MARRHSKKITLLPRDKRARREVEFFGIGACALLAALMVVAFCFSAYLTAENATPEGAAVVSSALADLTNSDRAQNGLAGLAVNPQLVEAAQEKADDMARIGYFAHVSPAGKDPWYWFDRVGYDFQYAGENLAVDFSDTGDVETALMHSPTHRANILDGHFTEVGIASAAGMYEGKETTFVVEEFASPAPMQAAAAEKVVPQNPAEPATASAPASAAPHALPLWDDIAAFPHTTLRYSYYALAALVILALAVETRLEFRWHHKKHAMRAAVLLSCMIVLFAAANIFFFATPVLAAGL